MNEAGATPPTRERITIQFASGQEAGFDIEVGRKGPAFFVLSVRKCGSTLLNNIAKALARANHCSFIDVAELSYQGNILAGIYCTEPKLQAILHPGNVYGGFRDMPLCFLGNALFEESPKVFMIRDPRDALVSEYYSSAYSHPIPAAPAEGGPQDPSVDTGRQYRSTRELLQRLREDALQTGVDEYVLSRAGAMVRTMMQYEPIMGSPVLTVLKYEDYIFDKGAMISLIASRFGWRAPDTLIEKILGWADKRPEQEDPTAFVRHVTPGDHRNKLRPETIARLNQLLRAPMSLFSYPP